MSSGGTEDNPKEDGGASPELLRWEAEVRKREEGVREREKAVLERERRVAGERSCSSHHDGIVGVL